MAHDRGRKEQSPRKGVEISPDVFETDLRPPGWEEDPDLRKAVDWFLTFLSPEEWKERRLASLQLFLDSVTGAVSTSGKGRFFDEKDQFAWYLFLGQAYLEHPTLYDFMFGSRVIPVLTSIGRNLELLVQVEGIERRVQRMVRKEKGQPNGALFELLVAAAYCREGARVAFVDEQPGTAKTHDMDVHLDGVDWAVECKRMELGEYTEDEREMARILWTPVARGLYDGGFDAICTATFLVELRSVDKDYFARKAAQWARAGGLIPLKWSDDVCIGEIKRLDLKPLQGLLQTDDVAMNGSRLLELLAGDYKPHRKMLTALRVKFGDNPLYIESCDAGVAFDWDSRSVSAIEGKARDVLKRLADGTNQLPTGRRGIVHIGLEAVDGPEVELVRHQKVMNSISNFAPGAKQLEYVYVHWFAPECPPQAPPAFDETCHWQAVLATKPRPLEDGFLVVPPESGTRQGVHWSPSPP